MVLTTPAPGARRRTTYLRDLAGTGFLYHGAVKSCSAEPPGGLRCGTAFREGEAERRGGCITGVDLTTDPRNRNDVDRGRERA